MKKKEENIEPEEDMEMTSGNYAEGDSAIDDNEEQAQAEEPEHAHPSLKEVIQENAREDEQPLSSTLSLRTILGGDILNTQAIRRQVWLFLLITIFAVLYISNRYSCQKQQIEIDKLTQVLKTSKYKTLSLSSILTERCRESHVVELLRANNDSTIHPADQPPYIIMTER